MHSSPTIADSVYGILPGNDVPEQIAGLNRTEDGNENVITIGTVSPYRWCCFNDLNQPGCCGTPAALLPPCCEQT